ncbi:hypothetical protein ACAX43_02730 [Paraburkholderia sp. IW21]
MTAIHVRVETTMALLWSAIVILAAYFGTYFRADFSTCMSAA